MIELPHTWDDLERLYENGTFCPEAWVSLSSNTRGDWRICCYSGSIGGDAQTVSPMASLNHPERIENRLAMLRGQRHSACQRCYHTMDQGMTARREKIMNSWRGDSELREKVLQAVRATHQTGEIDLTYLDRIDIKFTGNQCNLKCFTCHPGSSSSLGVEAVQMGERPAGYKPVQNPFMNFTQPVSDALWADLRVMFPKTRILNFTGGEPFMIDAYWEMIDVAVEMGAAANMELHLSSNMTAIKWGKRSVLDYFQHFKHVRLQASIDSYREWNDYIRYPSDFQTIIDNIKRVQDTTTNVHVVAASVVSALNVKTIPTLNRYLARQGIPHVFNNVLFEPSYQRIEWLPDEVKRTYLDEAYYQTTGYEGLVAALQQPEDLTQHQKLLARCRALDKHRGTDATKLWPEFMW